MKSKISHVGVIDSIEDSHVRVRIVQTAACAGCKVASHCHSALSLGSPKDASEAKVKIIDVWTDTKGLSIGQEVVVSTSGETASRAVLLGFGIPLSILLGVLIGLKMAGEGDVIAALGGIGALIPYYISMWLLRQRIARRVSFQLEWKKEEI